MDRLQQWEARPEVQSVAWPEGQKPSQMLQTLIDAILGLEKETAQAAGLRR